MRKVVILDIDDCINTMGKDIIRLGIAYFAQKGVIIDLNMDAYNVKNIFGVTQQQDEEFWRDNYLELLQGEPQPNASKVTKMLQILGFKIVIVTARGSSYYNLNGRSIEEVTKDWLQKYNIHYDELYTGVEDKVEFVKQLRPFAALDDVGKYLAGYVKFIPHVYRFNALHNRKKPVTDGVVAVDSWLQLYSELEPLAPKAHKSSRKQKKPLETEEMEFVQLELF